jgi:hypothetical protein
MPLTHNIADIPIVLRLAGADREPYLTPEGAGSAAVSVIDTACKEFEPPG